MDNRFRPVRAILFLVVTLALLFLAYILVMRVDFGGASKVTVRFTAIGTIQPGSPVRQSGVKVGSVATVKLAPDDRKSVDVTLSLAQGIHIRNSDKIAIVTSGLLGDQYVDIAPGTADAPLVGPQDILLGQEGLDLKSLVDNGSTLVRDLGQSSEIVSTLLSEHKEDFNRILLDIERGVHQAAEAAQKTNQLLGQIQTSWPDVQSTLKSLKETSQTINRVLQKLTVSGSIADWASDPQTGQTARSTLDNLQAVTKNLREMTDALEKALH